MIYRIRAQATFHREMETLAARDRQLWAGLSETLEDVRQRLRAGGSKYRKLQTVHMYPYEISVYRVHVRRFGQFRLYMGFFQHEEDRRAEIVPLLFSRERIHHRELSRMIRQVAANYENLLPWGVPPLQPHRDRTSPNCQLRPIPRYPSPHTTPHTGP